MIWMLLASVSSFRWPPKYGRASVGGVIKADLSVFISSSSLLLS